MERSPIKDVEIKVLLKAALTNKINDREVYLNGIDASYHYEGYYVYKTEELQDETSELKLVNPPCHSLNSEYFELYEGQGCFII